MSFIEWFAMLYEVDDVKACDLLVGVNYYSPGPYWDELQSALVWC